jgi:hypothetical protein
MTTPIAAQIEAVHRILYEPARLDQIRDDTNSISVLLGMTAEARTRFTVGTSSVPGTLRQESSKRPTAATASPVPCSR